MRSTERIRRAWFHQATHAEGQKALLSGLWLTCVAKAQTSHHSVEVAYSKIVRAA